MSGTQTNFLDAVEIAYLNATAAGVFVAASAGNSGPGNQVAHMSPWITTVANSTHDRAAVAELALGNGSVYSGASVFSGTLPSAPMVLSRPDPTELESCLSSESDILRHRRLYCGYYDRCLDFSIARGWQSFTCTRCPLAEYADTEPRAGAFAQERRPDSWR